MYEVLVTKYNLDEALEYVRRVEKELDQVMAITPRSLRQPSSLECIFSDGAQSCLRFASQSHVRCFHMSKAMLKASRSLCQ